MAVAQEIGLEGPPLGKVMAQLRTSTKDHDGFCSWVEAAQAEGRLRGSLETFWDALA